MIDPTTGNQHVEGNTMTLSDGILWLWWVLACVVASMVDGPLGVAVLASTIGWFLGGFLIGADSLSMHLETGDNPGNPAGWAVFGAAYGSVSGIAIAWSMHQSPERKAS